MNFEFFKQKIKDKISPGDEISLFADPDDCVPSGRYKVASLGVDREGCIFAILVGMGRLEGSICQVSLDAHEED